MSRNLCSSSCPHCGRVVRLADIRGKPAEFRRYGPYAPVLGFKWQCDCGVYYFVIWRSNHEFWGREGLAHADDPEMPPQYTGPGGARIPNRHQGRFYFEQPGFSEDASTIRYETGTFTLDLSYYETYNDEPMWDPVAQDAIHEGIKEPHHLCTDNAEDVQVEW